MNAVLGGTGWDNRVVTGLLRQYPRRLESAVERLSREIEEAERKFRPGARHTEPDDPAVDEGWRRASTGIIDEESLVRARQQLFRLKNARTEPKVPEFPGVEVLEKIWQQPIKSARGGIVGFIDLAVEARLPLLDWGYDPLSCSVNDDLLPQLEAMHGDARWHYFDVRARIKSVGELMREVQTVRGLLPYGSEYYVVSPDKTYAGVLMEQGVNFVLFEQGVGR